VCRGVREFVVKQKFHQIFYPSVRELFGEEMFFRCLIHLKKELNDYRELQISTKGVWKKCKIYICSYYFLVAIDSVRSRFRRNRRLYINPNLVFFLW